MVPNINSVFLKIAYVGIALKKPEQFVDDSLQEKMFGSCNRKASFQIET
jgi:hypothetical protein